MARLTTFSKILLFILSLGIPLAAGWIQSIYKFATSDFDPINKREIVYGLGIVIPPVGGVVGWFNIEDQPKKEN